MTTTHARWTADLRSGNFRQTTDGNLQDSKGYCCLGVRATQDADKWISNSGGRMAPMLKGSLLAGGKLDDLSGKLSDAYLVQIGITKHQASTLMMMNDLGVKFDALADVIESEQFKTEIGLNWLSCGEGKRAVNSRCLAEFDANGWRKVTPLTAEDKAMLAELEG